MISIRSFGACLRRISPFKLRVEKTYSTDGQDLFFKMLLNDQPGFFVDVGARDGVHISNTFLLEKRGWKGICVEPHPILYQQLSKKRKSKTLNLAIADVGEEQTVLQFAMWKEGALGHSGLVDVDYRHTKALEDIHHELVDVNVVSVETLLEKEGVTHVDVLDIDVEGAELSVVRSIDFSKCHINYVSVEQSSQELEQVLTDNGFRRIGLRGEDSIYANQTILLPENEIEAHE